jgi:hypothetical protein
MGDVGILDRDQVYDRTAVKLSFARAEGRNYRQLPDRATLREEPPPAEIFYSKRYSLSRFDVSGSMIFFRHGSNAQRSLVRVLFHFLRSTQPGLGLPVTWLAAEH